MLYNFKFSQTSILLDIRALLGPIADGSASSASILETMTYRGTTIAKQPAINWPPRPPRQHEVGRSCLYIPTFKLEFGSSYSTITAHKRGNTFLLNTLQIVQSQDPTSSMQLTLLLSLAGYLTCLIHAAVMPSSEDSAPLAKMSIESTGPAVSHEALPLSLLHHCLLPRN